MDEISKKLDEEFKNYLEVINPHITQIENLQIHDNFNKWVEKLTSFGEKQLRNKYTFLMSYQISKGYIDEPFLDEPPPELEDFSMVDSSDSSRSGSAADSPNTAREPTRREVKLNRDINVWTNPILNSTSENDCYESVSNHANESTASKFVNIFGEQPNSIGDGDTLVEQTVSNDSKEESLKTAVEAIDETKDSDVRKYNTVTVSEPHMGRPSPPIVRPISKKPKPKLSVVKIYSNHEERLKNLILKLREIKRQKDVEARCKMGPLASERGVQISCVDTASMELTLLKRKYKMLLTMRHQLNRKLKASEQRIWMLEEMRCNQEKEIVSLRRSGQENIIEARKIHEAITLLKEDLENRLKEHLQKTSNYTTELEKKHRKEVEEKDKRILDLERVVKHLEIKIEISKNSGCNFEGGLVFRADKAVSTDDTGEYVAKLERRVEKLMRTKSKVAKHYENKMQTLEQEKQILQTNLQLQIFKQRVHHHHGTHSAGVTQQEFAKTMEELEQKYMRMIALIQATAIKTRIQDQQNLETILRAMRGLKPEGNSSSVVNCDQGEWSSFPSCSTANQNFSAPDQQRQSSQLFEVKQTSGKTGLAHQILDFINPTFVEFCSCKNESNSAVEFPQREFQEH